MRRDSEPSPGELDPSTIAVVAGRGRRPGGPLVEGPDFTAAFRAGGERTYARDGTGTWDALEEAIGLLDGGGAVSFGSGMAAIAAVLEALMPARVAIAADAYLEVRRLLASRAEAGRLELELIDPTDTDAAVAALDRVDLLWLDALANPFLDVPELDRIGTAAGESAAALVVDATLATPLLCRPIELGADVVVHSATKYIGGHADLLLGVAIAREPELEQRIRRQRTQLGAVPGAMEAWLALRGLRTLPLRLERGSATAELLAGRLIEHPAVRSVRYAGLAADPAHETATRVLDGFGAVVSFQLAAPEAAERVLSEVSLMTAAGSLGGVETLIERQGRWHGGDEVSGALLRLSVGCEHPEDLWRDLSRALDGAA